MTPISHSKPWLLPQDDIALQGILRSAWTIGGPFQREARAIIARMTGSDRSFLFPSGRVALSAALRALALPANSGVVVQAYACDAVAWAIEAAGYRAVLCDLGEGWLCSPDSVAAVLDEGVRAILLAPPFGLFQSAEPFRAFGLPIIHDLCQANPAVLSDRWGQAGDLAVFSFHPTKYLGAAGGGAVAICKTSYEAALSIDEDEFGATAPLNEFAAALIVEQFRRVDQARDRRRDLVMRYRDLLPGHWSAPLARCADVTQGDLFRFVLKIPGLDFEAVRDACAAQSIAVRRGVDALLEGTSAERFGQAHLAYATTLSLPLHPTLVPEDADRVAGLVRAVDAQG